MSITTDGMEVVAWFVTTENQDGTKQSYPLSGRYKDVKDACDFGEPVALVTLASAQAAVAAERDKANKLAIANADNANELQERITELESALTAALAQPAPTGWDNGLSQDYDKGLGGWFADRLGARQELRESLAQPAGYTDADCLASEARWVSRLRCDIGCTQPDHCKDAEECGNDWEIYPRPAPARELSNAEKAIIRRALGDHGSFCYARANAIAQDKTGKTKVEWVGLAQDEGKTAYALMSDPLFARAVLAARG